MSRSHGKRTVITVEAVDISPHCNTSALTRTAKVHETTGYGADDEANDPGLKGGKFTMGGSYDTNATTGPSVALDPLVGTKVSVVRKTEGTGTGKPSQAFEAVLNSYVETNPVNDYVQWTAEMTIDGAVTKTTQA